MDLKELKVKIKEVELGEFEGDFLNSLFEDIRVGDFSSTTKGNLEVTKMESKASIGDLVFFRSYSKGNPNMETRTGVVIKSTPKSFIYLAKVGGKIVKVESGYSFLKKNGMALLGFFPVYKKEVKVIKEDK